MLGNATAYVKIVRNPFVAPEGAVQNLTSASSDVTNFCAKGHKTTWLLLLQVQLSMLYDFRSRMKPLLMSLMLLKSWIDAIFRS